MSRATGSTNEKPPKEPHTIGMTTEEKLNVLANLIVDKIMEDQANRKTLLRRIKREHATNLTTS